MAKRSRTRVKNIIKAKKPQHKQHVPSSLKQTVWLLCNGKRFEAKCFVKWCQNTVNVFNFEAGHDIPESKGGATNVDNIKPICGACNKSIGNKCTISEYSEMHGKKKSKWFFL